MEQGEYVTVRHKVDLPCGYNEDVVKNVVKSYIKKGHDVGCNKLEGEFYNLDGKKCDRIALTFSGNPAKGVKMLSDLGKDIYQTVL